MRPIDEISAVPAIREYVVRHPTSGAAHRFEREDAALGFAADLAVVMGSGHLRDELREVTVEYPSGAVVALRARVIKAAGS